MSTKRPIVIWRQEPVDVETAFYNALFETREGCVIALHGKGENRKSLDWGTLSGVREITIIPGNIDQTIDCVASEYPGAVHVFYGVRNGMLRILSRVRSRRQVTTVIVAERPNDHTGRPLGRVVNHLSAIAYRYLAWRTRDLIDGFLAMGERGVEQYARYGFERGKLFEFMYVSWSHPPLPVQRAARPVMNCVYVGRIDSPNKGIDVILDAVDSQGADWNVDFVGDYGDDLARVRARARDDSRVRHLGAWPPKEVVAQMTSYDVCLVPSRYDGWNVNVNHAINAGIACIVSRDATSNELIEMSGSGLVVPTGDAEALANAVNSIGSGSLTAMRQAATEFRERISFHSAVEYFDEILDHLDSDGSAPRPVAPWRMS